jgi:hypothetical protein
MPNSGQSSITPPTFGGDPAAHGAARDTKYPSYLGHSGPITDGLDGTPTPSFEFLRTSLWSHALTRQKSPRFDKSSKAQLGLQTRKLTT